jgi:hypothetical protein
LNGELFKPLELRYKVLLISYIEAGLRLGGEMGHCYDDDDDQMVQAFACNLSFVRGRPPAEQEDKFHIIAYVIMWVQRTWMDGWMDEANKGERALL